MIKIDPIKFILEDQEVQAIQIMTGLGTIRDYFKQKNFENIKRLDLNYLQKVLNDIIDSINSVEEISEDDRPIPKPISKYDDTCILCEHGEDHEH